jgi:vacuolar-type H+-ATPase subunit H
VRDLTTELSKLIQEEESAIKALDEAKKRADEVVLEANKRAKEILDAARDESAFHAYAEERSKEIEERRKETISEADAECGRLAARAERNLEKAIHLALQKILGSVA